RVRGAPYSSRRTFPASSGAGLPTSVRKAHALRRTALRRSWCHRLRLDSLLVEERVEVGDVIRDAAAKPRVCGPRTFRPPILQRPDRDGPEIFGGLTFAESSRGVDVDFVHAQ